MTLNIEVGTTLKNSIMKKLLLIATLFLGIISLKAQESHFGAKLTGSFTSFRASGNDASNWNDNTKGKINLEIGLVGEFMLSDKFALAPELNYAGEGDVYEVSGLKATIFTSYLQIPVMAKYYLNDNFSLNFGPQVGFLMSAESESTLTINGQTNTDSQDLKDKFNSTEFGFNMGAGYKLDNGLFFDFRYSLGLSKLLKNDDAGNLKSDGIKLGIGYFFN